MSRPPKLDAAAVTLKLPEIPGWQVVDGCLARTFKFADFVEAWRFMSGVALIAEKMDHHPDWSNVYSVVSVKLMTHDAAGITSLDVELAGFMNELYKK